MRTCKECNIIFESGRSYSNHIRWKHNNKVYERFICKHCNKDFAKCGIKRHENLCDMSLNKKRNCLECGEIVIGYRKKFCNSSCSAKYSNARRDPFTTDRSYITPEWKEKQRQATIKQWNDGVHKISRQIYSSKNERAITKYFRETFTQDEWKTGGRLKLEESCFLSRDLWSDKLKICFEYDGAWHFKDINGQLKMKQYKDVLLEKWCKEHKYRLVRIDELEYKNVEQIVDLVYNIPDNISIIKVGNRYN